MWSAILRESKTPVKGQRKITSFFAREEVGTRLGQGGGDVEENRNRDTGMKVRVSRMKSGKVSSKLGTAGGREGLG